MAKYAELSAKMYRYSDEIAKVKTNLSFQLKSRAQISSQLLALEIKSEQNAVRLKKLSNTLSDAIRYYSEAEKRVATYPGNFGAPEKKPNLVFPDIFKKRVFGIADSFENTDTTQKINWWQWSDTWNFMKQLGMVGPAISFFGRILTGGEPLKTGFQMFGDAAKITERVAGAVSKGGNSFNWGALFGFTKESGMPLGKAFGAEWQKYNMGNAVSVSDKVKVGAKWFGSIATVLVTGYDNFAVEKNSFGRSLAETVGESALKIGFAAGVGAVMTAVGAPVAVGGLVTVGAAWGVNRISEAIFGKGAAETVSDFVLDTIGNAGKKIGEFGESVGHAVSDGVNTVGNAINDGLSAVGNAVNDGLNTVGNAVNDGVKAIGDGAKVVGDALSGFWNNTFSW
jgi:hypothetical protein